MSKSLAISGHFRPNQKLGGFASFFQNLLRGIEVVIDCDDRFRDLEVTVFHGPSGPVYRCEQFQYRELRSRLGRFGADLKFAALHSHSFDASLFPNYFRPPFVRSGRSVTVMHDLLHIHRPELLEPYHRRWLTFAQRYALDHSDAVVTISQAVKDDIGRNYGTKWAEKIRPIWNPIAFERLEGAGPSSASGGRPYLLAVAVDRPHKNLYTLIRSFNELRREFPDLCLILAGEIRSRRPKDRRDDSKIRAEMPSSVDLVQELNLGDHVKITGFLPDAELGSLYRGAEAFVLPSLFEGFGMPAVESLAMGTTTVVSDSAVLREVTLGHAHYIVEPTSVDSMAATIAHALRIGRQARPTGEAVATIKQLFHPTAVATRYLETIFDLPKARQTTDLASREKTSQGIFVGAAAPSATQ